MTEITSGPRPSDKWIPWYIALFFTLMVLTLVPMAWIAVKTMPGTVTEHSYEKGLAYNKTLAAAEREKSLGWQSDINIDGKDAERRLSFSLKDSAGAALDNAEVAARMTRPVQGGMDQTVKLSSVGNGRYEAVVRFPAPGVWDVAVSATRGDDNYQANKRVELK